MSSVVNSVHGVAEAASQQNNLMSLSLSNLILAPIPASSRVVALVDRRARNNPHHPSINNTHTRGIICCICFNCLI